MLRGSKRLVEEQASQASLWSWRRDLLRPRHLHLLLWNYSYLLQRALCGWVECAWGNTSWTPPGASPSELFQSLTNSRHYHGAQQSQKDTVCCAFIPESDCTWSGRAGRWNWVGSNSCIYGNTYILINWKLLYLEFDFVTFLNLFDSVTFQDIWMRNKLVSIWHLYLSCIEGPIGKNVPLHVIKN